MFSPKAGFTHPAFIICVRMDSNTRAYCMQYAQARLYRLPSGSSLSLAIRR